MYLPGSAPYRSTWERIIAAAEKYNEPGRFTAFIGYEWTSQVPPGNNLHRVVVYRDDGDAGAVRPSRSRRIRRGQHRSRGPVEGARRRTRTRPAGACSRSRTTATLSNGMMFPSRSIRRRTSRSDARLRRDARAAGSRSTRSTQIKGDGEAHPFLSPDDEFADYETWDKGNLNLSEAKKPEMLQDEYARSALQTGLAARAEARREPVQVRHDRLDRQPHRRWPTADEDNFFGKHSGVEPSPERCEHRVRAQFGDVSADGLADGGLRLRGGLGDRRTRARRSSTR